nr:MAG TPA: hypothetical protein [Caudoviricetes sp.]
MSIKTLAARVQYAGGNQIGRMNKQKLKSLQWALKNDYNSRMIKTPNKLAIPCLINTGNLKSDYDKKYISVEFSSGLEAGDTFEILDDGTHWMIYLPILTETAYLRSEIIRCRYQLEIDGDLYWIYFQGPTETDLRWFLKNQININELNLSGTIYIKNDEKTKHFFKRFTHIKIDGHIWEVQVTDPITVPGILELEVQEYYDNSIAELPEIKEVSGEYPLNTIKGVDVVKQDTVVGYSIDPLCYDKNIIWKVENNPRVRLQEILEDGRICKVKIYPGAIKTFDICYGEQKRTITIDWAKPIIQGPQEVYPYETHTYWIKGENTKATFSIDSDLAKIIETGNDYCKVEIISGKKGEFVLYCTPEGQEQTELNIKIKSL